MRISEMQRREPFAEILHETLKNVIRQRYSNVEVLSPDATGGSTWLMQPLLSACFVPHLATRARHFLRDNFRYSPVTWRAPLQWLLGTFLASPFGLRLGAKPAFKLSAAIPDEAHLLVVPGNQRIRFFNFSTGTCMVFLKHGFSTQTMLREIQVRGSGVTGPFPSLTAYSADGMWFEEPIIDGFALPRIRPGLDRVGFEREAVRLLGDWLASSTTECPGKEYVERLIGEVREHLQSNTWVHEFGFRTLSAWIDVLGVISSRMETVPVAMTHGDFQPGNILVESATHRVYLIDWEHSARRFRYFDQLVYGLGVRSARGLGARLREFIAGVSTHPVLDGVPEERAWRQSAAALLLLEELAWRAAEYAGSPYVNASETLRHLIEEFRALGDRLEGLFGTAGD